MEVKKYSEWRDTNITMHMILQMMGKTMLNKMYPQPEWNQSLLNITSEGFTTGLINDHEFSFEVRLNLQSGNVTATCTSGATAGFALRNNTSVAEYYNDYMEMLKNIGHPVEIYPIPQEVFFTTPFNEQTNKVDFDKNSALNHFQLCVLVRNALLDFAAKYRGKKILPAMFWGTFDLTTVLFSGDEKPFPGEGIIEKVAFNEQFVEFGFWPGDEKVDDPALFILAYPFLEKDISDLPIVPKEAYYSPELAEYFLPLADAFKYDNPGKVIADFCERAFLNIAEVENWKNKDWLLEPFKMEDFK